MKWRGGRCAEGHFIPFFDFTFLFPAISNLFFFLLSFPTLFLHFSIFPPHFHQLFLFFLSSFLWLLISVSICFSRFQSVSINYFDIESNSLGIGFSRGKSFILHRPSFMIFWYYSSIHHLIFNSTRLAISNVFFFF